MLVFKKNKNKDSKFKTARQYERYVPKSCVGGITTDYVLMDKRCLCSELITLARYARRHATDFIIIKQINLKKEDWPSTHGRCS